MKKICGPILGLLGIIGIALPMSVRSQPTIIRQPQSADAPTGSSVTLSVGAVTPGSGPGPLPTVTSGTLKAWLRGDAGVVTNSSGQVSVWQDQSGNGNDVSQSNSAQQPTLISGATSGSAYSAVFFNGIQDFSLGDYLHGDNDLTLSNAYTSFLFYVEADPGTAYDRAAAMVGQYQQTGAVRGNMIREGDWCFSAWGLDWCSGFSIPTNSARLWTTRANTNMSQIEMFDTDGTESNYFSINTGFYAGQFQPPSPGYYVGGLGDQTRNYHGSVAELIYYRGSLTDSDRQSVQDYFTEKYVFGGTTAGLSYQWLFDGTNITGATNASLTFVDAETTNAGSYSVIVTSSAGAITSSVAVLALGAAPTFTAQPQSQSVPAGATATFSNVVSGAGPISYQWSFDGTSITGATNSFLTITNASSSQAGIYQVTATSAFGTATSSNALLTIQIPTVLVSSVATTGGSTVVVPVQLLSVGTEVGLGFSLKYNPAVLTFAGAVLGNDDQGSFLLVNTNNTSIGELGLAIDLTSNPSVGTNEIAEVTFKVAVLTNATTTTIKFGGAPTAEEISDAYGNPLSSSYVQGTVTISKAILEGDVWPVPLGDGFVTISDWVEEGRFVAGLDTTTNADELLRADCAPRSTGGDGELTVADWVQVGRYAAGLDPLTAVGYPPQENSARKAPIKTSAPRAVAIVPMSQGALTNTVSVQLAAQGGENSIGFSVSFDPAAARFVNAALGSGATGAVLFQNTTQAASGHLGFVLGYSLQGSPTSFSSGNQQLLRLNFASISYSNNVALNFGDAPVVRDLVDVNAQSLAASYQSILLPIGGTAWPGLSAGQQASGKLTLTWPATGAFVLESATSLTGPWTPVVAAPSTNGSGLSLDVNTSTGQTFYRLQAQ